MNIIAFFKKKTSDRVKALWLIASEFVYSCKWACLLSFSWLAVCCSNESLFLINSQWIKSSPNLRFSRSKSCFCFETCENIEVNGLPKAFRSEFKWRAKGDFLYSLAREILLLWKNTLIIPHVSFKTISQKKCRILWYSKRFEYMIPCTYLIQILHVSFTSNMKFTAPHFYSM